MSLAFFVGFNLAWITVWVVSVPLLRPAVEATVGEPWAINSGLEKKAQATWSPGLSCIW